MPPKTSANKAQEKIELELRKLTRIDGNKTCVDCPEKMPGYVNLTHHTFVCTRCSGIHRELQFKVKGISMSVFTAEDVSDVAATGNAAHNALYLAKYGNAISPNGSDVSKLREFIKNKYVDRKWFANGSSTSSNSSAVDRNRSSDHHSGEHTSSDTGDLWGSKQSSTSRASSAVKEQITKQAFPVVVADSFGLDLLDIDPSPRPAPAAKAPVSLQRQFESASESAFSGAPKGAFDAFGGAQSSGFDAFGGQISGGFDAFGGSQHQPTPVFDVFGGSSKVVAQKSPEVFDAFKSPHQSMGNGSPQQQGFGDFSGFSNSAPMPFIKVSPPTAAEKAAEEAILAATLAKAPPPPKNFNVFDEIGGPPPQMHGYGPPRGYPPNPYGGPGGNPFDNPGASNPFGGPPAPTPFGGPGGNPFGGQMPPQGAYPPAPQGFYPGMPPHGQGMPQHMAPGMPPHMPPGMPPHMPPQGPGAPYGYPQGPPGPYGYPPHYPPQQQQGFPPYGFAPNGQPQPHGPGSAPYGAPQSVVIAPKEPVAPDPFSTVGGLGWGEVSKPTTYQPSPNTISASYNQSSGNTTTSSSSPKQRQPDLSDPFSHQPSSPTIPAPSPTYSIPAPAAESGNPFDMF